MTYVVLKYTKKNETDLSWKYFIEEIYKIISKNIRSLNNNKINENKKINYTKFSSFF